MKKWAYTLLLLLVSCGSPPALTGTVSLVDENSIKIELAPAEIKLVPAAAFDSYSKANRYALEASLREAGQRYKECSAYLTRLSGTLPDATLKIRQCENEYHVKYSNAMDGFYNSLSGEASKTVADTAGMFGLDGPHGKYVIAAKSRRHKGVRQLVEASESYYWFIPVEIMGKVNTIALNNSNMYGAETRLP